jgi:O-methyltransferase
MAIRRARSGVRRRRSGEWAATPEGGDAAEQLALLAPEDRSIVDRALPHTMTGVARLQAVVDAVRYCVGREVPGDFAECGVWRGGSVLAMALALQQLGRANRHLHLYDTFEGMTAPTAHDVSPVDRPALEVWNEARGRGERPWKEVFSEQSFSEDQVRDLLLSSGYPPQLIHLVRGAVEETLPEHAPEALALLRLDTDWYESTRHELEHLYPRLSDGGVLIVDDYGHWEGARRAVDEYFRVHGPPPLLARVDYTCRIAVKH